MKDFLTMPAPTPRQLLDLIGIQYLEKTGRLQFCCCFHDDRDPSAGFYLDTGLAFCFSCEYTLDTIQFYAKYKEMPRREAIRDLEKTFGEINEKAAEYDKNLLGLAYGRMEKNLKHAKGKLPRKLHALYAEAGDKALGLYEKLTIGPELLDTFFQKWYNSLKEDLNETRPDNGRTAEASLHGGLQEAIGYLPRAGSQRDGLAVEDPHAEDSVDLD